MTNLMLEKLARAIAREMHPELREPETEWPNYIWEARAVLMALREPDEGMIAAGHASRTSGARYFLPATIFTAMIDHILEGETK